MSAPALAEMADAVQAAWRLTESFGELPGAHIEASPHHPGRVKVSLHGGLGTFEVWREALRIPEEEVRLTQGASNAYLTATGAFNGAEVVLVAYSSPMPAGGVR